MKQTSDQLSERQNERSHDAVQTKERKIEQTQG